MGTTVGWLLDQSALQLRCRGGARGLDREIDCALTSELVDASEWLSGGELLLTTGMRLPPDAAGRADYLRSLADVGIAGVGFGTGLGYDTVPADLVDLADSLDLPLLEVPLPIPFSAIARMLLDRLAEERYAQFTRATRSQPAMTRAIISGGVSGLVAELATALDRSVAFIDSDGRVVSSTSQVFAAGPDPDRTDKESAALSHVRALIARGPMSTTGVTITAEHTITVQRISAGAGVVGYLAVIGVDPLGDVHRVLVGHAASLVTLQHAEAGNVATDRAALQSEILDIALQGAALPPTAAELLGRVADGDGSVRVAVYEFRSAAVASDAVVTISAELTARWRPVFCVQRDREVVVVLRGDDDVTVVLALAGRTRMRAGVGPATDLAGLMSSAGEARQAARSAPDGEVVDLETTRSVLAIGAVQDGLRGLHDVRLRPLLEVRASGGADLVATLRGYLEANGHWETAASTVGVHRHTLRHRVSRIEGLLQVDLGDARTRAELLLILLSGDRPPS